MSDKSHFTADEARAAGERLGIDWVRSSFDLEQFRMGMDVELEHGKHDLETNVTDDDVTVTTQCSGASHPPNPMAELRDSAELRLITAQVLDWAWLVSIEDLRVSGQERQVASAGGGDREAVAQPSRTRSGPPSGDRARRADHHRRYCTSARDGPVGQVVWIIDVVDHYVRSVAGGGDAIGLGFGVGNGLVSGSQEG